MKVGILTYHNAINYGAVLQAYALQQVILNFGAECEILDYACPAVDKQYRRKKLSERASWKVYVMDFFSAHRLDDKKAAFAAFSRKNLKLSSKIRTFSADDLKGFDVVIVGSDQVFNPKNTEGDSAYLLDFSGHFKKVSYAGSIGNNDYLDLWQTKYNVDYKKLLGAFSDISFREKEAADFASNLFGKQYETVLDPVLLGGNALWKQFCVEAKEEYIFVYNLGNISLTAEYVHALHKKTGLKVYVVNKDIKGDVMFRKYENISSVSPDGFVKMLFGAKYIVTDSFHGTAFSILFHKDFYSVVNPNKENTNSRLFSLLSGLGLENRIVSSNLDMELKEMPDYGAVDEKLQVLRDGSIAWLKSALDL